MMACMETSRWVVVSYRRRLPVQRAPAGRKGSAPAPGFVAEPATFLAVRVAAGPGMTRGVGAVPAVALLRSLLSIAGRELDFKLIELVPLGFGSLPLRYREQLLQA